MNKMKPGDILIFQAGDSWVSKCIAKLTNSDVSHSAMIYTEDRIVEMSRNGIELSCCYDEKDGDKAYLLRMEPPRDPIPLMNAARFYLDKKIKYNFPDLVLLGGLLIYRNFLPTLPWKKITNHILKMACLELDKLITKLTHEEGAMICSQFVYQCYLDCGKEYEIIIKDGLLQVGVSMATKVCLADLVSNMLPNASNTEILPQEPNEDIFLKKSNVDTLQKIPEAEVLAKELYDVLEEFSEEKVTDFLSTKSLEAKECPDPINSKLEVLGTEHLEDTINLAKGFMDSFKKLLEISGVDLPVKALFVTPSDLLEHAVNLKQLGIVHIVRR